MKNTSNKPKIVRDKKEKAMDSESYKNAMQKLVSRQVTSQEIQQIYDRCQERPQTKVSRDTLIIKLISLLEYFEERNEGITEDDEGFISKNDTIKMIIRNPRIITSDINNNIIVKCQVLTSKKDGNIKEANKLIKSNPGVFRKTVDTIKAGR